MCAETIGFFADLLTHTIGVHCNFGSEFRIYRRSGVAYSSARDFIGLCTEDTLKASGTELAGY